MKVIVELIKDPQFIIILLFLIAVAVVFWPGRMDSTDKDYWSRSGMRLHTDHKTGVQYVSGPRGGLTPRLKADGTLHTLKDEENGR
jgi:hypothetical protein